MSREILVVKREVLFAEKYFEGFCSIDENDFINIILKEFEYQERNIELENNPDFKQIVPYVWIVNKKKKEAFFYKRSTGGDEGRLHNKYSGGVGGHIDKETEENTENPLVAAMMREMREEVQMTNYPTPKFIGFLNDDSSVVGKVHFGAVAIAETSENVIPVMHMSQGEFFSIERVDDLLKNPENDVENWTRISWPFVKKLIESSSK